MARLQAASQRSAGVNVGRGLRKDSLQNIEKDSWNK